MIKQTDYPDYCTPKQWEATIFIHKWLGIEYTGKTYFALKQFLDEHFDDAIDACNEYQELADVSSFYGSF